MAELDALAPPPPAAPEAPAGDPSAAGGWLVGAVLVVRFLPTLRLQLGALALLAVCLPMGVVIASGLVMFDMHDAEILAIAIASAVFALAGAVLLSRWILLPLERLRAGRLQGAAVLVPG